VLVTVFSKNDCNWCTRVKDLLRSRGIDFTERNIEQDEDAFEAALERGFRTMPQVYIDDELIGGFEATEAHLKNLINSV